MPGADYIALFTRPLESAGLTYMVTGATAAILRKLEYFREGGSTKHLTDIRAMLDVSGETIDRATLDEWIARLGLHAEWAGSQAGL